MREKPAIGAALTTFAEILANSSEYAGIKDEFRKHFPAFAHRVFDGNKTKNVVFPMGSSEHNSCLLKGIRVATPLTVFGSTLALFIISLNFSGDSSEGSSSGDDPRADNVLMEILYSTICAIASYPVFSAGEYLSRRTANLFGFYRESNQSPSEKLSQKIGALIDHVGKIDGLGEDSPLAIATQELKNLKQQIDKSNVVPLGDKSQLLLNS